VSWSFYCWRFTKQRAKLQLFFHIRKYSDKKVCFFCIMMNCGNSRGAYQRTNADCTPIPEYFQTKSKQSPKKVL